MISPRTLRTWADALFAALLVMLAMVLFAVPEVLVKATGLGLFLFAFALMAEERGDFGRGA